MFPFPRIVCIVVWIIVTLVAGQFDPHFKPGHAAFVQLVDWPYADIELECRDYLGPRGFGGVQVSPVNEVRQGASWMDRYEPVSFRLAGRSGNECAFRSMVEACNAAGVRVYVEVVLNHMARAEADQQTIRGTGGSVANAASLDYPDAGYGADDFNPSCPIANPLNAEELRNCWKDGRPDVNLRQPHVRQIIGDFLSRLLSFGVAGFFIDSALHMWPQDLRAIYDNLPHLRTGDGFFPPNSRSFMCLDLSYDGPGVPGVNWTEYAGLGRIAQDRFAYDIGEVLMKDKPFHYFVFLGTKLGYIPREKAFVYVNSPRLQRRANANGDHPVLSVQNPRAYRIALAFMLAHRYGLVRITSSYEFNEPNDGPPTDGRGYTVPVRFDDGGLCRKPWLCEHRWPVVEKMVQFRRATNGTPVNSWVDNGQNQIAFCRDRVGFVAFNTEVTQPLHTTIYTCLNGGAYCDLITGQMPTISPNGQCSGAIVTVNGEGKAAITIDNQLEDPFLVLLATTQPA